jgi:nitrate reductase gamma subunit
MSKSQKSPTFFAGRIAWFTGLACVACCAVPWLAIAVGSSTLAGLAIYSEKAAAAVALLGVFALIYKRLTRKSGPACDLDAGCGPAKGAGHAR